MSCSAVTLSIATVLSVVAVACLSIGFSTDNWYEIRVDSNKTKLYLQDQQTSAGSQPHLPADYESNYLYYSRDEGLFRVCFAEKKPKEGEFDEEFYLERTSFPVTRLKNRPLPVVGSKTGSPFFSEKW